MDSEVIRLYIKIGEKAIRDRMTVDEVINGLANLKQLVLTKEEFESIADFNATLRV